MKYSHDQQLAINSRSNTIVSASAGSGKTSVLSQRYVHLIEEGNHPSQILTLTFTKKAATEMYERIYGSLLTLNRKNPSKYTQEAVDEFSSNLISTLDSFCASVLRDHGTLLGISPQFQIDDKRVRKIIQRVLEEYLLQQKNDGLLLRFIHEYGFDQLQSDIFLPLVQGFSTLISSDSILQMIEEQYQLLEKEVDSITGQLDQIVSQVLMVEPQNKTMENNGFVLKILKDQLEHFTKEQSLAFFQAIEPKKLSLRGKASKDSEKVIYYEHIENLIPWLEKWKSLLFSFAQEIEQKQLAEHLDTILDLIRDSKRRESVLEYKDLLLSAKSLLLEHPGIADNYRESITHIMIDEFQDNNSEQRDLLFLLAAKKGYSELKIPSPDKLNSNKLFFVGDEKQSIYRFRGADVEVFHNLKRDLNNALTVEMNQNFRSSPSLVYFFNEVFSGLLQRKEFDFEAEYEKVVYGAKKITDENTGKDRKEEKSVEFLFVHKDLDEGDNAEEFLSQEDSAAFYLSQTVQSLGTTEYQFSDLAVLCRDSNRLRAIERMFLRMGIPFQSPEPFSLFSEAISSDFYLLSQFIDGSNTSFVFASLLRSPFIQLSDEKMLQILSLLGGIEPLSWILSFGDYEIRPQFQEVHSSIEAILNEKEWESLQSFSRMIKSARSKIDEVLNSELLAFFWYEGGYRQFIISNPRNQAYADHGDYLIEYARQYDDLNFKSFLTQWNRDLDRGTKPSELEVFSMNVSGVHLLTIHKAKGLEFPVVLLAGMNNMSNSRLSKKQFFMKDSSDRVYLNTRAKHSEKIGTFFFQNLERLEKAQEEAELKRLLYVALTRAEKKLYLFGGNDKQSGEAEFFSSLQSLFIHALGLDQEQIKDGQSQLKLDPSLLRIFDLEQKPRILRKLLWTHSSSSRIAPLDSQSINKKLSGYPVFIYQEFQKHFEASQLQHWLNEKKIAENSINSGNTLRHNSVQDRIEESSIEAETLESVFHGTDWGDLVHIFFENLMNCAVFNGPNRSFGFRDEEASGFDHCFGKYIDMLLWSKPISNKIDQFLEITKVKDSKAEVIAELRSASKQLLRNSIPLSDPAVEKASDQSMNRPKHRVELSLDLLQPILLEKGPSQVIIHCQIDLLIPMDDRIILVDYKTDRHLGGDLYQLQLSIYAQALEKLYGKSVEAFLYSVNLGKYIPLPLLTEEEIKNIISSLINEKEINKSLNITV